MSVWSRSRGQNRASIEHTSEEVRGGMEMDVSCVDFSKDLGQNEYVFVIVRERERERQASIAS